MTTALGQVRRTFFDTQHGQIHARVASPQAGSALHPPLFCFHQSPQSSIIFTAILPLLGADRIVYALDTPGFGDSFMPDGPLGIEGYADAFEEVIDGLGHAQFDILGYHTGALIGSELAIRRPTQARRLVLIGMAVFTQEEIDGFQSQPWPTPMEEDGSHVLAEWQRSVQWAGPGMTLDHIARGFVEKLRPGNKAWWGAKAAFEYPFSEKLPQVQQPLLAIGPKDDLWEISTRSEELIQNGTFQRLEDYGFGLFDVAPEQTNSLIRGHLDAGT